MMFLIPTLLIAADIDPSHAVERSSPAITQTVVVPKPKMFTFVWQNNYDTNLPHEVTQVLDITDMHRIRVFTQTTNGMIQIPMTNSYKVFTIRNYDPDTGLYDTTCN